MSIPTRPPLRESLKHKSLWLVLLSLTATSTRRLIPFWWRAWLWERREDEVARTKSVS